jgi:YHS domain-containing protein
MSLYRNFTLQTVIMKLSRHAPTAQFYIPLASSLIIISAMIFSCNQKPPAITTTQPATTDTLKPRFTKAMVDNKKDPSCGMPLTADIEDTVHYMGKVYGFCSDECKQAFLKNPGEVAKNADLK